MSLPVMLQRLIDKDHRIDEIIDETDDDNGYWIYFKRGWINTKTETHCIHESTISDCLFDYRHYIDKCECDQCVPEKNNQS